MSVLIGFECSGVIRRAMRMQGIEAYSCDLKPSYDDSPYHIEGDIFEVARSRAWRMAIMHPVCRYLTGSAEWAFSDPDYDRYPLVGYHQRVKPGTLVGEARREARREAVASWLSLWSLCANMDACAFENPVGHMSKAWRKADFSVQPYEFGDDASKRTCFWTSRELPRLEPTLRIAGRLVEYPKGSGKMVERWANQTDAGQNRVSPSEEREADRSVTYDGIGDAVAVQWGARFGALRAPKPFELVG